VHLVPSLTDLRVAVPVVVAWIVTAVLVGVPGAAPAVGAVAVVLAGASGVLLVRRRGRCRVIAAVAGLVLVAATLVALVAVAVAVGETRRAPEAVRSLVSGSGAAGGVARVEAEAVLQRDLVPGDRSVVARLVRVDGLVGLRVPVRLVPALHDDQPRTVLPAGTHVTASVSLRPDEPGSATAFVAFLRGAPTAVPPGGLLGATDSARQAFVRATADLPQPGAALLRGLAIGDRSGLDPATEAAMETSALTHLTAVSGDTIHKGGACISPSNDSHRRALASARERSRALASGQRAESEGEHFEDKSDAEQARAEGERQGDDAEDEAGRCRAVL
jgi:competence protein ComEC